MPVSHPLTLSHLFYCSGCKWRVPKYFMTLALDLGEGFVSRSHEKLLCCSHVKYKIPFRCIEPYNFTEIAGLRSLTW